MKLINLFLNSIKNKTIFSLIVSFAFLSFSCVSQKEKIKNAVTYNLESVFIGGQKNTMAKDKAGLTFDTGKKTASCSNKCTHLELRYSSKQNKFKFISVIPAAAACPDHLVGIESDLKENLPKVTNYLLQNKKLYFFNKKDTLLIFYEQ